MKGLKRVLAIIMSVSMITAMGTWGVSAAEASSEETMTEAEGETEELSLEERLARDLERLYSSEVPEEFFLVPKEKMVIEGWDWDFAFLHDKIDRGELSWEMFEPLYAYIAVVVNHDYLEPKGISTEEFEFDFSQEDLDVMKDYFASAIQHDQLSDHLAETYSDYNADDFSGDAELTECIMRAIFTFCITAGVDPADFWSGISFDTFYGLTPDKITFSDEQLHYFDD